MKGVFFKEFFLLPILICLFVFKSSGIQVDSIAPAKHSFDKTQWEKIKKDIDYSKETTQKQADRPNSFRIPISATAAKIILFSIVLGLLIFLLIKVFKGNILPGNKKISETGISVETVQEEDIHHADLEKLYYEACTNKNYRQAIRIYYLMIIRELLSQHFIRWKKEKTNHEYIFEMADHSFYSRFREITLLFERIWYGEVELDENNFHLINPRFHSLISELKRKTPAVETPGNHSAEI